MDFWLTECVPKRAARGVRSPAPNKRATHVGGSLIWHWSTLESNRRFDPRRPKNTSRKAMDFWQVECVPKRTAQGVRSPAPKNAVPFRVLRFFAGRSQMRRRRFDPRRPKNTSVSDGFLADRVRAEARSARCPVTGTKKRSTLSGAAFFCWSITDEKAAVRPTTSQKCEPQAMRFSLFFAHFPENFRFSSVRSGFFCI